MISVACVRSLQKGVEGEEVQANFDGVYSWKAGAEYRIWIRSHDGGGSSSKNPTKASGGPCAQRFDDGVSYLRGIGWNVKLLFRV